MLTTDIKTLVAVSMTMIGVFNFLSYIKSKLLFEFLIFHIPLNNLYNKVNKLNYFF